MKNKAKHFLRPNTIRNRKYNTITIVHKQNYLSHILNFLQHAKIHIRTHTYSNLIIYPQYMKNI